MTKSADGTDFQSRAEGFQSLTSAVQRQCDVFTSVRGCSVRRLFKLNTPSSHSSLFANVRPGNCQITALTTQMTESETRSGAFPRCGMNIRENP